MGWSLTGLWYFITRIIRFRQAGLGQKAFWEKEEGEDSADDTSTVVSGLGEVLSHFVFFFSLGLIATPVENNDVPEENLSITFLRF